MEPKTRWLILCESPKIIKKIIEKETIWECNVKTMTTFRFLQNIQNLGWMTMLNS